MWQGKIPGILGQKNDWTQVKRNWSVLRVWSFDTLSRQLGDLGKIIAIIYSLGILSSKIRHLDILTHICNLIYSGGCHSGQPRLCSEMLSQSKANIPKKTKGKTIKNRKEKGWIRHLLHEARIRIKELVFIKDFEMYLVLFLCKGVLTAPFWLWCGWLTVYVGVPGRGSSWMKETCYLRI